MNGKTPTDDNGPGIKLLMSMLWGTEQKTPLYCIYLGNINCGSGVRQHLYLKDERRKLTRGYAVLRDRGICLLVKIMRNQGDALSLVEEPLPVLSLNVVLPFVNAWFLPHWDAVSCAPPHSSSSLTSKPASAGHQSQRLCCWKQHLTTVYLPHAPERPSSLPSLCREFP